MDSIWDLLDSPAYTEVLLCVISGNNYATSIARILNKKQPTVTEQLNELEKLGLILPLQRVKAKKYDVNWDIILKIFYDIISETFKARNEYLTATEIKRVKKVGFRKIIPPEFAEVFLREYFLTFVDMGGKRKRFDEIIFALFSALKNLEKSSWKKLVKRFGINEKGLSILANVMAFEVDGVERVAISSYLMDITENGMKHKK